MPKNYVKLILILLIPLVLIAIYGMSNYSFPNDDIRLDSTPRHLYMLFTSIPFWSLFIAFLLVYALLLRHTRTDFSRYVPDVVCINLGTNDTSYPAYDSCLLTNAFVNLVHTIRGNYPEAKIVLLSGTMRKGKLLAGLLECLNNAVEILRNEGESEVYQYDFAPADGSLGYGSFKHPSLREHTRMAEELSAYLRSLMRW